jgi:Putative zinc- or iron-chelating domain
MGEAKRRREARERSIVARNTATGERVETRRAGDPLALREGLWKRGNALLEGRVETAHVPCAGCRECCYYGGVDVYPQAESAENLAHLDLEKRDDGRFYLRKREDGACVHLGPEGCTVYEHRPRACRVYDCRPYALFGVLDIFDGDHVQPMWAFQPATREGRIFEATCKMMGMIENKRARDSGRPATADEVATTVMTSPKFGEVAAALDAVSKMPPDELAKVLGIDPRSLTAEEMALGMQKLFGGDVLAVVREP